MIKSPLIKYIGIGIVFTILLLVILINYSNHKALEKDYKYTVGVVYDVKARGNGGYNVYYTYKVSNIKIENMETDTYFGHKLLNNKYLVKYQPSRPENCKILFEYQVNNSVKPPKNGWDELPIKN